MTRWRMKALIVTAPAMAAALVIAGCGGDDSSGAAADTATGSAPEAAAAVTTVAGQQINEHGSMDVTGKTEIDMEMDDYYFEPSILTGTPGQKITINLENASQTEHNFSLEAQKVNTDIEAGDKATVTVTLPKSGVLSFFCEYHAAKGMAGALKAS